MKILITGATGKVGSRLAQYFLNQKENIRLLVSDEKRANSLKEQGAEIIVGDLTNLNDLKKAVAGIDVIIHTAAAFRGVSDQTQKSVNLDATLSLAKAALEAKVQRFIFASTTMFISEIRLIARPQKTMNRLEKRLIQQVKLLPKKDFTAY